MERIDYVFGYKFQGTQLTYVRDIERVTKTRRRALMLCACGKTTETDIGHVRNKRTVSCGCVLLAAVIKAKTTHGQASRGKASGAYRSWQSMHERAGVLKGYLHISICSRWDTFENFYADMGDRPDGYTIERTNNLGNYEPSNCVWADDFTQAANRSGNVNVTIDGETHIVAEWCRKYNVSRFTVNSRIRSGMSVIDAITTPLLRKKKA